MCLKCAILLCCMTGIAYAQEPPAPPAGQAQDASGSQAGNDHSTAKPAAATPTDQGTSQKTAPAEPTSKKTETGSQAGGSTAPTTAMSGKSAAPSGGDGTAGKTAGSGQPQKQHETTAGTVKKGNPAQEVKVVTGPIVPTISPEQKLLDALDAGLSRAASEGTRADIAGLQARAASVRASLAAKGDAVQAARLATELLDELYKQPASAPLPAPLPAAKSGWTAQTYLVAAMLVALLAPLLGVAGTWWAVQRRLYKAGLV